MQCAAATFTCISTARNEQGDGGGAHEHGVLYRLGRGQELAGAGQTEGNGASAAKKLTLCTVVRKREREIYIISLWSM